MDTSKLIGKHVEVDVALPIADVAPNYVKTEDKIEYECPACGVMHRKIIRFYHGKLESEDGDSVCIQDIKEGIIIVSKKHVNKIKEMKHDHITKKYDEMDTIGARLKINPDIHKDVEVLDDKLKNFKKRGW
jgi:hypothetical protein